MLPIDIWNNPIKVREIRKKLPPASPRKCHQILLSNPTIEKSTGKAISPLINDFIGLSSLGVLLEKDKSHCNFKNPPPPVNAELFVPRRDLSVSSDNFMYSQTSSPLFGAISIAPLRFLFSIRAEGLTVQP
jgi:hypothetical protein